MPISSTIEALVEVVVGIMLLPIMAGFVYVVSQDENLSTYFGITLIMTLIVYVFAFGVLLKGISTLRIK